MIPLWYQGLSNFFHEKFEKQENVDVLFHCSDGVIGAHQILVSLASKLLLRVLSDLESLDSDVVVIVPDLTVEQVTLFLSAVYGGTVPPMEDSEFQSLTDVLEVLGVEVPSKNGDVDVLKPTSIEYLVDNIVRGNLTLIFALFVQSYPYGRCYRLRQLNKGLVAFDLHLMCAFTSRFYGKKILVSRIESRTTWHDHHNQFSPILSASSKLL